MVTEPDPRVVVTGLGATTPLGGDVATTWEAALAGRSGARTLDPGLGRRARPAGHASRASVAVRRRPSVLERVEARRLDRVRQYALIAAREAWADAGCAGGRAASGSAWSSPPASAASHTLLDAVRHAAREGPAPGLPADRARCSCRTAPAAAVGLELGAQAGVHTPVSACASGAEAIGYGVDMIRTGRADVVVAGGTEAAIHPLPIAGFAAMQALSTRNDEPGAAPAGRTTSAATASCSARAPASSCWSPRSTPGPAAPRIYAEVAGAGHDLRRPPHRGARPGRRRRRPRHAAGAARAPALTPRDVVHLNAHATSTPVGDIAEATAIRAALGDAADHVAVSPRSR